MNVDFCNAKAYLIDSKELREKIFLECERIMETQLKRDSFPGSQPVAIERKNMPLKERYMVCEKTDGERGILLLLNINSKPMCFIINRKEELYFMDFAFKKEVFEGTVFDGEIIKNLKGVWNFIIHDCLAYNGVSFLKRNHSLRYACGIDFIVKRYNPRDTDCFFIKTKLFYDYGPEIVKTWDHIQKTSENKLDGLVLTPVYHPIIFGRDKMLLKWKTVHTIDFLVKIVSGKINLYYYKKNLSIFKSFKSDTKNYIHILETLKTDESVDLVKGVIVEFNVNGDEFTVHKVRTDKIRPNGEITVTNTLKNIQESIKIEEL